MVVNGDGRMEWMDRGESDVKSFSAQGDRSLWRGRRELPIQVARNRYRQWGRVYELGDNKVVIDERNNGRAIAFDALTSRSEE